MSLKNFSYVQLFWLFCRTAKAVTISPQQSMPDDVTRMSSPAANDGVMVRVCVLCVCLRFLSYVLSYVSTVVFLLSNHDMPNVTNSKSL